MQKTRYSQEVRTAIMLLDFSMLLLAVWLLNKDYKTWTDKDYITCGILGFIWFLGSSRTNIYRIPRMLTYTSFAERILSQLILFFAGCCMVYYLNHSGVVVFSKRFIIGFSLLFVGLKSFLFLLIKSARRHGYNHRNVMFLEQTPASVYLNGIMQQRRDYGFRVYKMHSEPTRENLRVFWKEKAIHSIFLPLHSECANLSKIALLAEKENVKVNFVPDILCDEFATFELTYAKTLPLLMRSHFPLEHFGNKFLKRALDILLSVTFLVFIASWLFPILAILIKKDSSGSVFFRQKRYGYRDRIFYCYKFRTMEQNLRSDTCTTDKNDSRITRIGAYLRKSSLDELPQFWNVLRGEMSVVGPRPHMISVDDYYREFVNHYSVRNKVKPGITGLAQIEGLRGDSGDMNMEMQKRILADAFYVKNWSLSMDFIICIKTLIILIRGDKNAF